MSDVYEEFDAEDALDTLLTQHQNSLTATVGTALNVSAGLQRAASVESIVMSHGVDLRDRNVAWLISLNTCERTSEVRLLDFPVPSGAESSSLNGVLDAIQHEIEELETLARRIGEQSAAAGPSAETEASPVKLAVLGARDELGRIMKLLSAGGITKESATSEFSLAVHLLDEQRANRRAADTQDDPLCDMTWVRHSITARLARLLQLRELVVRLFEDSNAGAFQLS
ncbi:hypothetical protein AMK27_38355 [Streptomyces sp. CB02009]|uniref:hypothetical protein n=1 Tax=Streptomyces sp. CB02009 TaxID=1703938 RepID=UPI00095EB14D|nr:hypothetical protein [Streptomyces sp. CB02009]OKJ48633.1 hypothetical protein AMK27_38355 [Streptomyces sp. CB02009]